MRARSRAILWECDDYGLATVLTSNLHEDDAANVLDQEHGAHLTARGSISPRPSVLHARNADQ